MTPPPKSDPATNATRRAWTRTLLLLGVVGAVVLGIVLRGLEAPSSRFSLADMSTAGLMPMGENPAAREPGEPAREAAAKGKGNKDSKDKHDKGKHDKGKGDKGKGDKGKGDKGKGDKGKGDKHSKGNKQGKGKGKGDKQGKGDKSGKDKKARVSDKANPSKATTGELPATTGEPVTAPEESQAGTAMVAAVDAPTLAFQPVADARVEEANPATNFGVSDLRVDGNADPDVESYLRFEVSGVTDTVRTATLRLWVPAGGGTANGPVVFRAPNTWAETGPTGITWTNRPGSTGTALDNKAAILEGAWVEFDVTAAVSGDGTYNFVLKPESGDGANFLSREGANPPQLVVYFGPVPTPTPTPGVTPTATATATPTPTPTPGSGPADARVQEANPTTNYGTAQELRVDGAADPDVESYLRFTVTGVTDTVRTATLRLWVPSGGSTANGPAVFRAPNTWTEGGLTWANRPGSTGTALDNKASIPSNAWVEYNVTAAVSGNGTYNFVLKPESTDGANFLSRESTDAAHGPQLVVESGPIPTPTPVPTPDPNAPPVVMAAGDNVCGADSTGANCKQMATSDLVLAAAPHAVLVLGDVQYECGEASDFTSFYDPSWGRVKDRTHPSVGNHEYNTSTDPNHACFGNPPRAQAYFDYFGAAAGDPAKGYYSFDLGAWHLIALNSNCSKAGGCGVGSAQWTWLKNDLAAHPTACTLAYWHHPLYSSGGRATTATQALYQALFDANAEIVLSGHDHTYERFKPQNANTQVDNVRGIRQFVVGTGGRNLTSWGPIAANSEVRNNTTFGVLQLTLHPSSYDWEFVPIAGQSFTDTGTTACH